MFKFEVRGLLEEMTKATLENSNKHHPPQLMTSTAAVPSNHGIPFPHVLKPSTPDLADRASSGLDFLPLLEVVRQLQRTKIRQLRMGDEEVEWVSKEVSPGGNCKGLRRPQCICWILFGHFRKSSRSGSIRKSHPLWGHCCSLPKKMLWEQGNTIEPCRHWLYDEMEKIIAACITCADFKALRSSRPESESDVAG